MYATVHRKDKLWHNSLLQCHLVCVVLVTAGLYFCFKKLTDANIFIIMYGVTSIYFAVSLDTCQRHCNYLHRIPVTLQHRISVFSLCQLMNWRVTALCCAAPGTVVCFVDRWHKVHQNLAVVLSCLHCVSKNHAQLFLSELCQISTNFDNFWHKDGKEAKIVRHALIFHLTCFASPHYRVKCTTP